MNYQRGYEYGRKTAASMVTAERRRANDRYARESEYVRKESPTRAFWLGFRRGMRAA